MKRKKRKKENNNLTKSAMYNNRILSMQQFSAITGIYLPGDGVWTR